MTRFELAPSAALATSIVGAHAAAGLGVWLVFPHAAGIALACALAALGAAAAWSRALLRAPASIRAVEIERDTAQLVLANGRRLALPPNGRHYVTRFLVALPLGGLFGRTALISADMLRPGEFRRLRIWALWKRQPA